MGVNENRVLRVKPRFLLACVSVGTVTTFPDIARLEDYISWGEIMNPTLDLQSSRCFGNIWWKMIYRQLN